MPSKVTLNQAASIHDQIKRFIERRINLGFFKPGDRLPSEAELQDIFGVSRTPVRQALETLVGEGLIYRSQGRGSFVRDRKIGGALKEMISFGKELRDSGHSIEPKTLAVAKVSCNQSYAEELNCDPGDEVIHLRRLFIVDKEPLVLFDHFLKPMLPLELFMQEGDFDSLHGLLSKEGFIPWEGVQSVSAILANQDEAAVLGISTPAAAILIQQTYFSATGEPLWCSRFLVRADRYEYKVHLSQSAF